MNPAELLIDSPKWMTPDSLALITMAGSHAYGLATEQSDVDPPIPAIDEVCRRILLQSRGLQRG